MLMPVRVLEAIGGFGGVRNLLAEDQAIGIRVRKAGYSIRLSHHVIDNVNQARSFRWFLNRHSRWFKIRRRLAPPTFLTEPLANLGTIGLVWALSDESGVAWGGLLVLVGLGMLRDAVQTRWLRGSFPRLRHLLLSPVKDLFLLPVWFDALVNRRIDWRGNRFLVGPFTRLRLARVPRTVRRRVRRVRRLRFRHRRIRGSAPWRGVGSGAHRCPACPGEELRVFHASRCKLGRADLGLDRPPVPRSLLDHARGHGDDALVPEFRRRRAGSSTAATRRGAPLHLSRPEPAPRRDRLRGRADGAVGKRARRRRRSSPRASGTSCSRCSRSGRIDVVVNGYELTETRARDYLATRPYYVYQLQVMAPRNGPVRSWDDLLKPRPGGGRWQVGVLTSSAADAFAREQGGERSRSSRSTARPTR